jgi:hypothetical protein
MSEAHADLLKELHRRLTAWFEAEVPNLGNVEDGEPGQAFSVEIACTGYDDDGEKYVSATVKTAHEDLLT